MIARVELAWHSFYVARDVLGCTTFEALREALIVLFWGL